MARAMHPDSAGSQFFIMHKTSPHLDGAYAAFGKVTEGLEIVDKIASTPTDFRDMPLEPQKIRTITVETIRQRISKTGNLLIFRDIILLASHDVPFFARRARKQPIPHERTSAGNRQRNSLL